MAPDDEYLDPAQVLATRRHQLLDAALMKTVLSDVLSPMFEKSAIVDACELDYLRLRAGRYVSTVFKIALAFQDRDDTSVRHVSCTVWPTSAAARQQYEAELSPDAARASVDSSSISRPGRPVALVPEMQMVVRLLHADPNLRGLPGASDEGGMMALLEDHLPECREEGWRITRVSHEVLSYRPKCRCTLLYTVRLDHPRASDTRSHRVIGKLFSDERWQTCHAVQQAAWRAARASGGAWHAARPVASVPEWKFVASEMLPGRPLAEILSSVAADDASEHERAKTQLTAVARAVRAMQTAEMPPGPLFDLASIIRNDRKLKALRRAQPVLAAELTRLQEALTVLERRPAQPRFCFAHGDLTPNNILIDGENVGIVDFDRAGHAEAAYDIACFLTRLSWLLHRLPQWRRHASSLIDAFRGAYLRVAPDVSPRRLALFEAADLWSYVLRKYVKKAHLAGWSEWALEQTAIAWARISEAADSRPKD